MPRRLFVLLVVWRKPSVWAVTFFFFPRGHKVLTVRQSSRGMIVMDHVFRFRNVDYIVHPLYDFKL
jgi:hypothetical protein